MYAEGAGVGGRNTVNYWGANNWEDNTGHTNHKVEMNEIKEELKIYLTISVAGSQWCMEQ